MSPALLILGTITVAARIVIAAIATKNRPQPEPLKNGNVHFTGLDFMDFANYSCDSGYILRGYESRLCQADGQRSEKLPKCHPVICPPPPVSEFSVLSYQRLKPGNISVFQDEIKFQCLSPYVLFGNETSVCQADGNWSILPECRKCSQPEDIENGYIYLLLHRAYCYKETVTYGCNPTYVLDELAESRCEKTGQWSAKPVCRAPCAILVKKATVLYNNQKVKLQDHFKNGIQHAESIWFFCKNKEQHCSYKVPVQCDDGNFIVPDCFKGDKVQDHFGNSVAMSPALLILGTIAVTAHTILAAIAKKCPDPGPLKNGNIHFTDLSYPNFIRFSCDPGYTLQGPNTSQCLANGQWSAKLPECQPVICPLPPDCEFSVLSCHRLQPGNKSVFQDKIKFECLLPYALFGSETAVCQADGKWSALPECRFVECPRPEGIENGYIYLLLRRAYHYKETVTYGCNPMYVLDGPAESSCEKTGQWSAKPVCRAPCAIPVKKATVLYNNQKVKVQDHFKNGIQHAESIWFFCKNKEQHCSYKVPVQCEDGNFTVPACFKEQRMTSFLKTDIADLPPCDTIN